MGHLLVRRALLLVALLVVPALVALAPTAAAGVPASCPLYSTQTVRLVEGWYVRTQEYRCSSTSGDTTFTHHVSIVRVAESRGDPDREDDDRILLHAEYQAESERKADGDGTRETSVNVQDSDGRIGYYELEYGDSTTDGECSARVSYYRGSETQRHGSFLLPACLPEHDLLP